MRLSLYLIYVVLFIGIFSGLTNIWIYHADAYSYSVDEETFINDFNMINDTKLYASTLETDIQGSEVNEDANDFAIVKDTISITKKVFNAFSWTKDIIKSISDILVIPPFVYDIITTIIAIALAFGVLSIWFRTRT